MRIVLISDTHGKYDELGILSGDVLSHCGDICNVFNQNIQDIAQGKRKKK